MNRRALVIALIVAIFGVALLFVYVKRFEQEASGGEPVSVLTALKDIEPGTLLNEDVLATRLIPRAYVEDRAVQAKDRASIVGMRLGQGVKAQQVLMWTDLLINSDQPRQLSSLVQPGMRAFSINATNRADKSYGLIGPGDRIDIIATVATGNNTANNDQSASVVLLQNVLVLNVGTDIATEVNDRKQSERRELLLSVSVTLPEAQLLTLAAKKGDLSVALRNPDDVRVTEAIADMPMSVLTEGATRKEVPRHWISRPPPAPEPTGPTPLGPAPKK